MNSAVSAVHGKHLYAIVPSSFGEIGRDIGINGAPVYKIQNNDLAAIVSDISVRRLRPERKHLAAHSAVLQTILDATTPLPIAFGVVADSHEAVKTLLKRHANVLQGHLTRLENKAEMSVHIKLDLDNVFDYFIRTNDDLRALKNRLYANGRTPNQNEKIELGRVCEQILNHERETAAQQLENALEDLCVDSNRAVLRHESDVANLTCLIEKADFDKFNAAVETFAGQFSDDFAFKITGPFAPHNFVELHLNT